MATTIEFTQEPHPLAAKAGLGPWTWSKTYRLRWLALFVMLNARCHPAIGYITAKEVPTKIGGKERPA